MKKIMFGALIAFILYIVVVGVMIVYPITVVDDAEIYTLEDVQNVIEVLETMQDSKCDEWCIEWFVVTYEGITNFITVNEETIYVNYEFKYTIDELIEMSADND